MIRTAIKIDDVRISEHDLSAVNLYQEIGNHHHFELKFIKSSEKDFVIDSAKQWIGKDVSIGFENVEDENIGSTDMPDYFKGIVTDIRNTFLDGTSILMVKGKSKTIHLEDGPRTKPFMDMGLPQIIHEIEGETSSLSMGTVSSQCAHTLPYTVQYRESNFEFLNRLANRYGDWCYYDGKKLNFADSLPGSASVKLAYGSNLVEFDINISTASSAQELSAYTYLDNKTISEKSGGAFKSNTFGEVALKAAKSDLFTEKSSNTVHTDLEKPDLEHLARRHEEVALDETVLVTGASTTPLVKLGQAVEIEDSITGENYGSYNITKISHNIAQGGDYINEFEAVPVETTSAPQTASPQSPFCETQLAVVADVEDPDALGRVTVKFPWEPGENSPWLRIVSPYTGKDKGFYITPEVDDSVLVAFENNDAEKPYILGGMYHGQTKPEMFNPNNDFKGFKSKGENEWKFDDKNQMYSMSSQKDMEFFAKESFSFKTDGSAKSKFDIDIGQGKLTITAGEVVIKASQDVKIDGLNFKVNAKAGAEIGGATFKAEGKGNATVKGATVNVDGSGPTVIKGAIVKIN